MPGDTLLFFASLCLFLSSVEYAVPKPLPFMRLGLANLPVIFAAKSFRARDILLLVLLKVLLSSFISGTMFSYVFLFSAAGSLASGIAVFCLHALLRKSGADRLISGVGLCLAGALANNAAQIAVARALIFGRQAYVIAPLLLASGLLSALALGLFANAFEGRSRFLAAVREGRKRPPLHAAGSGGEASAGTGACGKGGILPLLSAAAAFALMLALPFTGSGTGLRGLPVKAVLWLLLLALDEAARKGKVRLLPSLIMIAGLTALSLLSPSGKVLRVVGGFRLTRGALEAGLSKGLTLTGMLFASQVIFSALRGRGLGRGGWAGRVLADFARLSGKALDIKGRGLVAALDGRLLELWQGEETPGIAGDGKGVSE